MKCATVIYEEFSVMQKAKKLKRRFSSLWRNDLCFVLQRLKVISSSKCKWRANLHVFLSFAAESQVLGSLLIAFYRLAYTEWIDDWEYMETVFGTGFIRTHVIYVGNYFKSLHAAISCQKDHKWTRFIIFPKSIKIQGLFYQSQSHQSSIVTWLSCCYEKNLSKYLF
jgi:hypothetical protein